LLAVPKLAKDPYLPVRVKLFGINLGALLSVWVILLIVVYSLMSQQLFAVLDDELRYSAVRIIHNYNNKQKAGPVPIGLGDLQITFSLWTIQHHGDVWAAAFVDGNPFVNVRQMYQLARSEPDGLYRTIEMQGGSYRAFFAVVRTEHGTFLIRVLRASGPTTATLGRLLFTLGVAGLAALALAIVLGLWLTSRSLAPMIGSWKRQQQFVADASHELRTPLSIIKTNLDVLFRHPDHTIESELHYLANAYAEVTRTSSLIDSLLTLARIDSRELMLIKQPLDLNTLVREVVETVELLALEQQKEVQVSLPSAPSQVLGDEGRLRQLLLILIDNALHYSGPGASIRLEVKPDTTTTTLAISDTGFGIEPKLLPRIFDRFVRGDSARHRHDQGGGLGLSIAKWIVEAHNGTILVNSTLGKGTTFTITLPA